MSVPVLMQFGSDRDFVKERVLKALQGEEIWCQLFSEPSGGTDLAGLRTRAETDGNGWKINGQKVWTSWAQYSDYGVIVVRTDPTVAKHKGLTYFWVDMKAPGVTVRPIKLAGGDSRSEEHTSELQSLMRISYAVFCLKKKNSQDNMRHNAKE